MIKENYQMTANNNFLKIIFFILFFTRFLFADDLVSDSLSYDALSRLFGNMGQVLICNESYCNDLVGNLFVVYNGVIISLLGFLFAYSFLASAINTAQDGAFLGQRWQGGTLPFKMLAGLAFLIPGTNGYSILQYFIMTVILQGAAAGNYVWSQVWKNHQMGYAILNTVEDTSSLKVDGMLEDAFYVAYCLYSLELEYPDVNKYNFIPVNEGRNNSFNTYEFLVGDKSCGHISFRDVAGVKESTIKQAHEIAFIEAVLDLKPIVESLYSSYLNNNIEPKENNNKRELYLSLKDYMYVIEQSIVNKIAKAYGNSIIESRDNNLQKEDNNKYGSWMMAGAFYYILADAQFDTKKYSEMLSIDSLQGKEKAIFNVNGVKIINDFLANYKDMKKSISGRATFDFVPPKLSSNSNVVDGVISDVVGFFEDIAYWFASFLNSSAEPLSAMKKIGYKILLGTDIAVISVIVSAIAFYIATKYSTPEMAYYFNIGMNVMLSILAMLFGLILKVGGWMSFYLPLLPAFIYFTGVVTWLMFVVDAMLAIPIVALGLTVPSDDYLGKASPAVLLITNIFLRPTLMVLGLVLSIRLMHLVFEFIKIALKPIITQSVAGSGMLAVPILLIIYISLFVGIAKHCLSLIYVIPDKVLSLIGYSARYINADSSEVIDRTTAIRSSMTQTYSNELSETASSLQRKKDKDDDEKDDDEKDDDKKDDDKKDDEDDDKKDDGDKK